MPTSDLLAVNDAMFVAEDETVSFDRVSLAKHLKSVGIDYDPSQPIRQFAGGLANRNYLIETDGELAVLRRPPAGELPRGAHDMAREHNVLRQLSPVLPFVPRSHHFCGDPAVIGAPFQLVEYRSGIVLRGSDASAAGPDAPARLSRMMVETLAAIHAADTAACGLGDLGRPEGFVERAIEGWGKRGAAAADGAKTESLVDGIVGWLRGHQFTVRAPTLLHLDFKLDNIILDPATLTPAAVVDWDMGTRGDPLFDLATLLSYWTEPGDPAVMTDLNLMPTASPGFWTRHQAAIHYAELTERPLDDLDALRVLAVLKTGVVFLQLHRQWIDGAVLSSRYEAFGRFGRELLVHAQDLTRARTR